MCVPCSANKCRIRESDLQAARLCIIFSNWYQAAFFIMEIPMSRLPLLLCTALILAACGYKGDLYLPKQDDKAQFGAVQTGLQFQPIQPQNQPQHD